MVPVIAIQSRGFTLIELLVVLLIMGMVVGMVSAVIRPDDRGQLRIEADRLAQLLDLAASESRLTGHSIAWTADRGGYRFWRANADSEWSELRDSDLFRARTLPGGMVLSNLQIENLVMPGPMRLEFSAYAPARAFSVQLAMGEAHTAVVGSAIGELRVVPAEGDTHGALAQR